MAIASQGYQAFKVGSLEFYVVSDGTIELPAAVMFQGVATEDVRRVLPDFDPESSFVCGMNSILVRSDGKLILVDTGLGPKESTRSALNSKPGDDAGTLLQNLAALGVKPEDVDIVINTHAHADHIGWNTIERDGRLVPTFPNATYMMGKIEWDFYTTPRRLEKWAVLGENLGPIVESGRYAVADGETNVTSEVSIVPSPGHTVGHTCIVLRSGGEMAIHIADLIHHPAEFVHPEWISKVDFLPKETEESRRLFTKIALENNALLVGSHTPFPGAGRILSPDGQNTWLQGS